MESAQDRRFEKIVGGFYLEGLTIAADGAVWFSDVIAEYRAARRTGGAAQRSALPGRGRQGRNHPEGRRESGRSPFEPATARPNA